MEELEEKIKPTAVSTVQSEIKSPETESPVFTFLFNAKCSIQHALTCDELKDRKDFMKLFRIKEQLNEILNKY